MSSDQACPQDRPLIEYLALFVDEDAFLTLVHRDTSGVSFPRIKCPEVPFRGDHMSACFSTQLERLTGASYKLVFLYSTINDVYQRHNSPPHKAIFEVVAPLTADRNEPIDPVTPGYEWVMTHKLAAKEVQWPHDVDYIGFMTLTRLLALTIHGFSVRDSLILKRWEYPNWFTETTGHAKDILARYGYHVIGEFAQHQVTSNAAVLRVNTKKGRVYLKASKTQEPATTRLVAKIAPFLVPDPLYVNGKGEWMLLEDYGQTLLDRFSMQHFEDILMLHGRLQVVSMNHIEELEKIGLKKPCVKSRIEQTRSLLECEDVRNDLKEREGRDRSIEYTGAVRIVLEMLYSTLKLPLGLVHGDLYDGNMTATAGEPGGRKYVVFDWGSARIDIPFSDVIFLEHEVVGHSVEKNRHGIDEYLRLWEGIYTVGQLRDICNVVAMKDRLVGILDQFLYAREEKLYPTLESHSLMQLHWALSGMCSSEALLRRITETVENAASVGV